MAIEGAGRAGRSWLWIDDTCICSGQCVLIDPELFDSNDDGTSRAIVPTPTAAQVPNARIAVENCPIGAIHLEEAPPA